MKGKLANKLNKAIDGATKPKPDVVPVVDKDECETVQAFGLFHVQGRGWRAFSCWVPREDVEMFGDLTHPNLKMIALQYIERAAFRVTD